MKEKSTEGTAESRPVWESLEAFARQGVQRLLQQLLEEEVEHALGRRRYERREGVDAAPGYRNGVGKPRRLSMSGGTITVHRPRVRGRESRFESRLLPLFKRRTEEVGEGGRHHGRRDRSDPEGTHGNDTVISPLTRRGRRRRKPRRRGSRRRRRGCRSAGTRSVSLSREPFEVEVLSRGV